MPTLAYYHAAEMSSFLHFVNKSLLKLQSESEENRRLNIHRIEKLTDPLLQQAERDKTEFILSFYLI